MNPFKTYHEAIRYLEGLANLPLEGNYLIDPHHLGGYLDRMQYFLDLVGNPERDMKYIHITGTAGKGTVTTMVHEILCAAGKKVGSFTSPFVTTSIEKIRVNDLYVAPGEFAAIVEDLKPTIDQAYLNGPHGRPSIFEIFLAIAFIYFKRQRCEYVVLEVGCGGRYDATNIIQKPLITAITNIDYDHMELLGKTLQKIALDKAGIIKKGSKFFTTEKRRPLIQMFEKTCHEVGAEFRLISDSDKSEDSNSALAAAICEAVGIDSEFISQGINRTALPARFETMQLLPHVIIDGAHNRIKMQNTAEKVRTLRYRKLFLVIGLASNKDYEMILREIVPLADVVSLTRFQTKERKAAHPLELQRVAAAFQKNGANISTTLDPQIALNQCLEQATENDLVLITGSFFLAGELRQNWITEEQILKYRQSFCSPRRTTTRRSGKLYHR